MRLTCLCILILSACSGYVGTSGPLQYRSNDFILIDSAKPTHPGFLIKGESQDFPIYYIGPLSDSISIGKRYWTGKTFYPEALPKSFTSTYDSSELEIKADTSVFCYSSIDYLGEGGRNIDDSSQWFHAFLLILKNKSDSTLYLGRTFSLFYIQLEGQCRDGQWTSIQKPLSEEWICGTGEPDIYLRPGEIILSKIKRRNDRDFVRYRLAWKGGGKVIYSNTFS